MASSRYSSNTPDWLDVAVNLAAFETMNKVKLEVRLEVTSQNDRAELLIAVIASTPADVTAERVALGSATVRCSATNLNTLEAALIHALYALDSQLAYSEMAGKNDKP